MQLGTLVFFLVHHLRSVQHFTRRMVPGSAPGHISDRAAEAKRRCGVCATRAGDRARRRVWERRTTHLAADARLRSEKRLRSLRSRSTLRPSVLSIPSSIPASCRDRNGKCATTRQKSDTRERE